jgi:hypothetical protein
MQKKKNYGKLKYISPCKNIPNLQRNPLKKRNQNPSRYYYNSIITNLSSFNTSQKISYFKFNPHIKKRPIIIIIIIT